MNGLGLKRGMGSAVLRMAGAAAALLALAVAGVLALFFAATIVLMAVIASALIGVTLLAMRARRTAKVRTGSSGVIDARRVGHTWVAYGWNEPRR